MNQTEAPLMLEIFLINARVRGQTREVKERVRLVDVLNTPEDYLRVEQAQVLMAGATEPRRFDGLNFEKRAIVAAMPLETREQLRQRSISTAFGGRSQTQEKTVTLLMPPFVVEGTMHLPQGMGDLGNRLHANASMLTRFVAVTDATLQLPGGVHVEAPVLLANRDAIAAMSVEVARRRLAETG